MKKVSTIFSWLQSICYSGREMGAQRGRQFAPRHTVSNRHLGGKENLGGTLCWHNASPPLCPSSLPPPTLWRICRLNSLPARMTLSHGETQTHSAPLSCLFLDPFRIRGVLSKPTCCPCSQKGRASRIKAGPPAILTNPAR